MRTGEQLRRAHADETVREVFVRLAGPRRRSGAVLIEDEEASAAGDLHRQRPGPALREAPRGRPRPADRRGHDRRPGTGSAVGATLAEAVEADEGAQDQRAAGGRPGRIAWSA